MTIRATDGPKKPIMEITDISKVLKRPREGWGLTRPVIDVQSLEQTVRAILEEIRQEGDKAVQKFSLQFDKADAVPFELSREAIEAGASGISEELKAAMRQAAAHICTFHMSQQHAEPSVETMPGVRCWRKPVAIERVGLYIPGGTAPLFSTLVMLAIPATIAGCREIILCSPPDGQGGLHPGHPVCGAAGRGDEDFPGRRCAGDCGDGLRNGVHSTG